jgi:hypothetical protein
MTIKQSVPKLLAASLLGGFLWGLFMFGFMTLIVVRVEPRELDITQIFLICMIGGFLWGILFALYLGLFVRKQTKRMQVFRQELLKQGNILLAGPAAKLHPTLTEGWLFLTEKELIFKPRSHRKGEMCIPLSGIHKVESLKRFGIVRVPIAIELTDGRIEKFNAYARNMWIERLNIR